MDTSKRNNNTHYENDLLFSLQKQIEQINTKFEEEIIKNRIVEELLNLEISRNRVAEDKIFKLENEYNQISKLWNTELYTKYVSDMLS